MAALRDTRLRLIQLAIVGLAALFGVMAGVNPLYAVLAIVAALFVVVTLSDLVVGLCLFTVVTFLDSVPNAVGSLSAVKLVGLLVFMSWLAGVAAGQSTGSFVARYPAFSGLCFALLVWVLLSALWSESLSAWWNDAQTWILNMALFPILFMALRRPRDLAWLFASFAAGALLSVAYGVLSGGTANVDGRLGGAGLGANIIGDLSSVAAILSATLAMQRDWSRGARGVFLLFAALSVVSVFLTASREAVLGLGMAIIIAPLVARRGRRLAVAAGALGAAVSAIVLFLAFTPAQVRSHLFAPDPTGSGRTNIWEVGLRMVAAHPFRGIGAGNFSNTTIHYLFRPGALQYSSYIVDQPKVAHNIYLEVLAELGVVGLAMFLLLVGFCLLCALRSAREFARAGDAPGELLARGLLLGLLAFLLADFFGSELLNKDLWLLLAASPALFAISRLRVTAGSRALAAQAGAG